MNKYTHSLLLLVLIVFASCETRNSADSIISDGLVTNPKYGSLQDSNNPPIEFELLKTLEFSDTDSLLISGFGFLKTDAEANMYFYDREQSKLISISENGDLRWATGQEGRGPGDFKNISGILLRNEQILVFNIGGTRIDYYDFGGTYIKSIPMGDEIKRMSPLGFSSDGLLVGSSTPTGLIGTRIKVAHLEEDSLTLINEFDINQAESITPLENLGSSSRVYLVNDKILSGNFDKYEIGAFDLKGNLEQRILRDLKITKPGIGQRPNGMTMFRTIGSVNAPRYLSTGHFFTTATWAPNITDPDSYAATGKPEAKFRNTLDFFSPNGVLLYSFETDGFSPEIGSIIHLDANDVLYIYKARGALTLNKYRLHLPE